MIKCVMKNQQKDISTLSIPMLKEILEWNSSQRTPIIIWNVHLTREFWWVVALAQLCVVGEGVINIVIVKLHIAIHLVRTAGLGSLTEALGQGQGRDIY